MACGNDERFFDRMAPYGPNGLSYGKGEDVHGAIFQMIQFRMKSGDNCAARGVMKMTDGRVYTWTIRAEGHSENGRYRLATLSNKSFEATAHDLFEFEHERIDPELIAEYEKQIMLL